ncbi:signal peptidase I [Desulfosporosinus orientis DSM 765]|uniref:Signal peptidase I n=1 Tax=Desulfosporosinus orientis (strain ATCC 19365 / DSM 765 / NCIMB 8382 / VKM B-1628 / Singapore I) TaxID=768706 RepID=G7W642_DESOD|nr:signal peptidase I [Desulfosporosinus orientis]AET67704.1 signal peptidase I [Desulfosporosinus orientis DSM 765]
MTPPKYTTQEQIESMREAIMREKEKMAGVTRGKESLQGQKLKVMLGIKILGKVFFVALSLLLVYSIISIQITKSRGEIPNILGYQMFAVESGSMEPTLKIGTVIISRKPKDPDNLKKDEIVTFRTLTNAVVTHRIIEVTNYNGGEAYRTKGDNPRNSADQELLTPDRVIGVFVAKIPLT